MDAAPFERAREGLVLGGFQAALLFSGTAAAVLAWVFFQAWRRHVRRPFVLAWCFAYAASVIHQAANGWFELGSGGAPAWTLHQLSLLANTICMAYGCALISRRRLPLPVVATVAGSFVTWTLIAPHAIRDFAEIMMPGALLIAATHLWAAWCFARIHREQALPGALPLAGGFAISGLHELDYPLFANIPAAAPWGYGLAALLMLFIAVQLLVLILEQSRLDVVAERSRLDAVLSDLPVGLLVALPDGGIARANEGARSLLGLRENLDTGGRGMSRTARFSWPEGEHADFAHLATQRALETGRDITVEAHAKRPDGAKTPTLVQARPFRDAHGKVLGAVTVVQDLSQHALAHEEQAREQRLQGLGTLAAGVAHDFNNALQMVVGHAELAESSEPSESVRRELGIIRRVAMDAALIARRIQDVARKTTVREKEQVDLAQVAREVIELSRPRWREEAAARGIAYDVDVELEPEVTTVGSPAELREALLNLLLNALDAMPDGGRLGIRVRGIGTEAVLEISDSGHGMTAEVRERLFEPFFTTKGRRGSGLGLAIVFGILQRHEGRVEVDSAPGRGTRFLLRLPRRKLEAVAPKAPKLALVQAPAEPAKKRILVVEDEPLVRQIAERALKRAGHEVFGASTGQQALALMKEKDVDTLVTDLGLPGMTGWQVATEMRRLHPNARIVVVTGWGDSCTPEQAKSAGVDELIGKPYDAKRLVDSVA